MYKDWDCFKIFFVFYLVGGQYFGGQLVDGQWVGGEAIAGFGVCGWLVGSNMIS